MLHAFHLQLAVQGGGAILETEVILLAAIEVDGQTSQCQPVLSGEQENIVLLPVRHVDRLAECGSHDPAQGRTRTPGIRQFLRSLRDQGSALRADGGKQFGVGKSKTQRPVPSHGNAGDGPTLRPGRTRYLPSM